MKIKENVMNRIVWMLRDPESWMSEEFVPVKKRIGYTGAVFGKEEYIAWIKSAFDGWFGLGRCGKDFERELATYVGQEFCLLANSGSSADLLMIASLKDDSFPKKLRDGDEVLVAANSFSTTVSSLINQSLVPVYVDPELGTYNPSAKSFEMAISEKTRAILITHALGNPNEIEQLQKICQDKNLILLEDNCDALGSKYRGKRTGSFGLMASFSFYPAHHITTAGEGGAVVTSDYQLLRILMGLRDWGRDCWCAGNCLDASGTCGKRFDWEISTPEGPVKVDHKHLFSRRGFNLKPTEQQAAFGLEQLKKIEEFNFIRKRNFEQLDKGLKNYEGFFILPKATENSEPAWFAYPLTIKENAPFTRSEIQKWLADKNIETRVMFGGNISAHPGFKGTGRISGELKNANLMLRNSFLIGCYHGITSEMVEYIVKSIGEFLSQFQVYV